MAGPKSVQLAFTNDHYGGQSADRNVHLDRLDVRNSADRIVASVELEDLPPGDCKGPDGDNFGLWCEAAAEVPIEIPSAGSYSIEVVAWADQAGDELARLSVVVVDADGSGVGADVIRNKLVELYDELLGVQVTSHSPDVEAAFQIFVNAMERRREVNDKQFEWYECDTDWDLSFIEGILDGAVVKDEDEESGWRHYDIVWPRVVDFMNGADFSDPHQTAQAWVVVLAYLLMDYRYLYL